MALEDYIISVAYLSPLSCFLLVLVGYMLFDLLVTLPCTTRGLKKETR